MTETFKVLVIVDIQNCFIQGGSLASPVISDLPGYIDQAIAIRDQIRSGGYDLIVFSRDFHPEYHSSLYHETDAANGVFVPHCRDTSRQCDRRYLGDMTTKKNGESVVKTTGEIIDSILKSSDGKSLDQKYQDFLKGIPRDKEVHGTDLSYLFYGFPEFIQTITTLNSDTKQQHTIGLKKTNALGAKNISYKSTPSKTNLNLNNITKVPNTNMIALTKGQYCDYESYSAFNYHIRMQNETELSNQNKKVSDNKLIHLPADEKYTTGLFEYIISENRKTRKSNLVIDVCGLVTNICVINTVQQGLAMWYKVYQSKVPLINSISFNLLDKLCIPLELSIPGYSYLHYPYTASIKDQSQFNNALALFDAKLDVDIFNPNNIKNNEEKRLYTFTIINDVQPRYKFRSSTVIPDNIINKIIKPTYDKTCKCGAPGCDSTSCIESLYRQKYLKYKQKYINLKNKKYLI